MTRSGSGNSREPQGEVEQRQAHARRTRRRPTRRGAGAIPRAAAAWLVGAGTDAVELAQLAAPQESARSACTSLRNRWLFATTTFRPLFAAAARIRSTPRLVSASGRSHSTCTPAASALSTCGSCRWLGVAMHHRVELGALEQVLDVGVHVAHAESVG